MGGARGARPPIRPDRRSGRRRAERADRGRLARPVEGRGRSRSAPTGRRRPGRTGRGTSRVLRPLRRRALRRRPPPRRPPTPRRPRHARPTYLRCRLHHRGLPHRSTRPIQPCTQPPTRSSDHRVPLTHPRHPPPPLLHHVPAHTPHAQSHKLAPRCPPPSDPAGHGTPGHGRAARPGPGPGRTRPDRTRPGPRTGSRAEPCWASTRSPEAARATTSTPSPKASTSTTGASAKPPAGGPATAAGIELGLDGEVASDDLQAVWGGLDPAPVSSSAGSRTARSAGSTCACGPRSRCRCCSPSATRTCRGRSADAHDAAVAAAFGYLETNAAGTRTGNGGLQIDRSTGSSRRCSGTAPAAPATRTSTPTCSSPTWPGPPTASGGPSTGGCCYHHAKTAGYLYQAHLRHELTVRLGVEWGPVEKGTADVVGIDRVGDLGVLRTAPADRRAPRQGRVPLRPSRADRHPRHPTRTRPRQRTGRSATLWEAKAAEIGFDPASSPT